MRSSAQHVAMPIRLSSAPARAPAEFSFRSLAPSARMSAAGARSLTLFLSLLAHGALTAAFVMVPLFMTEVLPTPVDAVRAFFVAPPSVAAPPPPPPPPPAGTRRAATAPPAPRPAEPPKLVAPTEVPSGSPPADEGSIWEWRVGFRAA